MAIKVRGCYKTINVSGETETIFVTSEVFGGHKGDDTFYAVIMLMKGDTARYFSLIELQSI